MKDVVLVVAAHPDDELLGCGGTLAAHVDAGDEVHVLILAEGSTSRSALRDTEKDTVELSNLEAAARKAGDFLGFSSVTCGKLPDNRMDSIDLLDIVKLVEHAIRRCDPTIIYTHHEGDVNVDHQFSHRAVYTACRPLPETRIKRIIAFETVSSTEWIPPASGRTFSPNWFVDVSATLQKKMDALAVYESEMRDWPHPRSLRAIEHLARWRGATIGVDAAEAFVLIRNIV